MRPIVVQRSPWPAGLVSFLLLVVACGGTAVPGDVGDSDPSGSWNLEAGTVDGSPMPLLANHPVTLHVEKRAYGMAPCNSYGGDIERRLDRTLRFVDLDSTAVGCGAAVDASEGAYLTALGKVDSFRQVGDELWLVGPGIEVRFVAATGIAGEFAPGIDPDREPPPTTTAPPMPDEEDCLPSGPPRVELEGLPLDLPDEPVTTTTIPETC